MFQINPKPQQKKMGRLKAAAVRKGTAAVLVFAVLVSSVFAGWPVISATDGTVKAVDSPFAAVSQGSTKWYPGASDFSRKIYDDYGGYEGISDSAIGTSPEYPYLISDAEDLAGLSYLLSGAGQAAAALLEENLLLVPEITGDAIEGDTTDSAIEGGGQTSGSGVVDETTGEAVKPTEPSEGENGSSSEGSGESGGSDGSQGSGDSSGNGSETGNDSESGTDPIVPVEPTVPVNPPDQESDNQGSGNTEQGGNTGTESKTESGAGTSTTGVLERLLSYFVEPVYAEEGKTPSNEDAAAEQKPADSKPDNTKENDGAVDPLPDSEPSSDAADPAPSPGAEDTITSPDTTTSTEAGRPATTPEAVESTPSSGALENLILSTLAAAEDPNVISGFQGRYFKLIGTLDESGFKKVIDLSNFSGESGSGGSGRLDWAPIGLTYPFAGTMTAEDGVEIINFTYSESHPGAYSYIGLFAQTASTAKLSNLHIVDAQVNLPSGSVFTGSCGGFVASNMGTIENCWFSGTISGMKGAKGTATTDQTGVGGIAGYSQGSTVNCISKVNIDIAENTSGGSYVKLGGIVGNQQKSGVISGCLVTGVIRGGGGGTSNDAAGGIVGELGANLPILRCGASIEISYVVIDIGNGNTVGSTNGIGGIAGHSAGQVTECFAMGKITTSDRGGGLVGYLTGSNSLVTRSFYTGTMEAKVSMNSGTAQRIGGLIGEQDRDSQGITESYFAGTLNHPYMGSIYHTGASAKLNNSHVYYDELLSPNAPVASQNTRPNDTPNVSTGALCSADFSGLTNATSGAITSDSAVVWQLSEGSYPKLAWTELLNQELGVDDSYRALINQFADLATYRWIDVDSGDLSDPSANSYGNIYQMLEGKLLELRIPSSRELDGDSSLVTNMEVTSSAVDITGEYGNKTIGKMMENKSSFTVKGQSYSALVERKALYAFHQSDSANTINTIETTAQFYDFLDYCQSGGGAYTGNTFVISAAALNLSGMPELKGIKDYDVNRFCATLNGGGCVIENAVFASNQKGQSGSNGMLGVGASPHCVVRSIRLSNPSGSNIIMESNYHRNFGILFSVLSGGTVSDINIENPVFDIAGNSSLIKSIGLLVGDGADNCTIRDCSVTGAEFSYGYSAHDRVGGLFGRMSGTVTNCYYDGTVTLSLSGQTDTFFGGIVGEMNGNLIMDSCHFSGGIEGGPQIGGLVGSTRYSTLTLKNSYASAEINQSANASAKPVGGLIGSGKSNNITNSFFWGNITGNSLVGGLAGSLAGGSITNCCAAGNIRSLSTSASQSGGLVGSITANNVNMITNSYYVGQGPTGAIAGTVKYRTGMFANCYYDRQIIGPYPGISGKADGGEDFDSSSIAGITALTSDEFTGTLPGFDQYTAGTENVYPMLSVFAGSESGGTEASLAAIKVFQFEESSSTGRVKASFKVADTSYTAISWDKLGDGAGNNWLVDNLNQDRSFELGGGSGDTVFTVRYQVGDKVYHDITTKVVVAPFDVGEGTERSPYIIYNLNVLKDFRDFINAGHGTQNTYYQIAECNFLTAGECKDGKHTSPASIDMSSIADWEPIGTVEHPFQGHLIGTGSEIKGLTSHGRGYLTDTSRVDVYAGLFGRVSNAQIQDLNLSGGTIQPVMPSPEAGQTTGNLYAGLLAAMYGEGQITNVTVKGTITAAPASDKMISVSGGLVGSVDSGNATVFNTVLTKVNTDVTITGSSPVALGRAGGIAGQVKDMNLTLSESGAFGSIREQGCAGGLIGAVSTADRSGSGSGFRTAVSNCASLVDIFAPALTGGETSAAGGLIGVNQPNHINSMQLFLEDSYAAGRITGSGRLGGLVGVSDITVDTKESVPTAGNGTPPPALASDADFLNGEFVPQVEAAISRCYYNWDLNSYPSVNPDVYAWWKEDKGNYKEDKYTLYSGSGLETVTNGQSNTWDMSKPNAAIGFGWSAALWKQLESDAPEGLYPILFTSDQSALHDTVKLKSIAVHLTRAGQAGLGKYANVYLRYAKASISLSDQSSGSGIRVTSNGRMLVSTADASEATAVITWNNGSQDLTREISYTPSTEASGVPDFSWYVINKAGMWDDPTERETEETYDSQGNVISSVTTVTEATCWTLYSADQLAGLGMLTAEEAQDGNGAWLAGATIEVSSDGAVTFPTTGAFELPEDQILSDDGRTVKKKVWRVRLGQDLDLDAYDSFTPIGSREKPFTQILEGRGYTLKNLKQTLTGSAEEGGLFGTIAGGSVIDLGIVSGAIDLNEASGAAGGIAARLKDGSLIDGCFSALGIYGTGGAISVGGLVGETISESGTPPQIQNSFYTGFIDAIGVQTKAGGLVGSLNGAELANSYSAGYINGEVYGSIAGAVSGTILAENLLVDENACGSMNFAGFGSLGGDRVRSLSTEVLCKRSIGSGWENPDGFYPVPKRFAMLAENPDDSTSSEAAVAISDSVKAAAFPVYLTPHSRSAAGGYVDVSSAAVSVTLGTDPIGWRPENEWGTAAFRDNSETGRKEILMDESGYILLDVNLGKVSRKVLFVLRCWYDNPVNGVYTISAPSELAELSTIVNGTVNQYNPNGTHQHGTGTPEDFSDSFAGKTVVLANDMDLSGVTFPPIGTTALPFKGTFDGKGHVVSNLDQSGSAETSGTGSGIMTGLFGVLDSGKVKNLGIQGGTMSSSEGIAGAIAARLINQSAINNCFSSVTIKGAGGVLGGLAGSLEFGSVIENSFSMSSVSGGRVSGGIAGESAGQIRQSYHTGSCIGEVGSSSVAGGIVGHLMADGVVSDSYNAGYVNASGFWPVAGGETSDSERPAGTVSADCWYDSQLISGQKQDGSTGKKTAEAAVNGHYPAGGFSSGASGIAEEDSQLFELASQLSTLALEFDGTYDQFQKAVANRSLEMGGLNLPVEFPVNGSSELFSRAVDGDSWIISVNENAASGGGGWLNAQAVLDTDRGSLTLSKPYYAFAKLTLTVRYRFDLSALIEGSNGNYHQSGSGSNTFDRSGAADTLTISTAEDFKSFAQYVSSGGATKGKTFRLDYNLDLSGTVLSQPIGTESNPFEGVFDGGCCTISNLGISSAGDAALFGRIGKNGRVKDLCLENITVQAQPSSGTLRAGTIAANNGGVLTNISVKNSQVSTEAADSSVSETMLGGLVGENSGKIRGCYFLRTEGFGLRSNLKSNQYAGGLVGKNQGGVDGCYISSDVWSGNRQMMNKGLFGTNLGSFSNCYFNCASDSVPRGIQYVTDEIPLESEGVVSEWFLGTTEMKSEKFASWISSTLYGQNYWHDSGKNGGFPELYCFELIKYDIPALNDNSIMLGVRNLMLEEGGSATVRGLNTFMNAVCDYRSFDFPYFSSFFFNNEIQAQLLALPQKVQASVAGEWYGRGIPYSSAAELTRTAEVRTVSGVSAFSKYSGDDQFNPRTLMIQIKLEPKAAESIPWGVYRESGTGQIR